MTNKENYLDTLAKCQSAINTIRASEHTIISEKNEDVKENMYKLSRNTLRYLLDVCFDDKIDLEDVWENLNLDEFFERID